MYRSESLFAGALPAAQCELAVPVQPTTNGRERARVATVATFERQRNLFAGDAAVLVLTRGRERLTLTADEYDRLESEWGEPANWTGCRVLIGGVGALRVIPAPSRAERIDTAEMQTTL